jgi:hypothetical protein
MRLWVSKHDGTEALPVDTGELRPSVYCWERNSRGLVFSPQLGSGLFEASLAARGAMGRISVWPWV